MLPMLRLQVAENKDRELLWNINQKYLYEMTCFYDDPILNEEETVLVFEVKSVQGDS